MFAMLWWCFSNGCIVYAGNADVWRKHSSTSTIMMIQKMPYHVGWLGKTAKDDRKAITVVFFGKHILVKERKAQGIDIRNMTTESVNQYYGCQKTLSQESHPAWQQDARGVSCPWRVLSRRGEGREGGRGYPCPRTWLGLPYHPPSPLRKNLGPETGGTPSLWKGHGTISHGVSSLPWTDRQTENITFQSYFVPGQ